MPQSVREESIRSCTRFVGTKHGGNEQGTALRELSPSMGLFRAAPSRPRFPPETVVGSKSIRMRMALPRYGKAPRGPIACGFRYRFVHSGRRLVVKTPPPQREVRGLLDSIGAPCPAEASSSTVCPVYPG